MKVNLVCKGGGITGIALIGAINFLEKEGFCWNQVAGTSAGSIIAALLSVGYTGYELKDILFNTDFKNFNDKNKIQSIPIIGQGLSLFMYKGLYSGNSIETFIQNKLLAKGKSKFKDISTNGKSNLKIIASDVTNKRLLKLPEDLKDYNIDPMEFNISKAIRMSISIPFYYNPVKLTFNKKKCYVVDGGLVSNYPIWIFDNSQEKYSTIGLNLQRDNSCSSFFNCHGFIPYLFDIIDTTLNHDETAYLKNYNSIHQINIPTYKIKITDFNLSTSSICDLYNSGYNSAKNYLKNNKI